MTHTKIIVFYLVLYSFFRTFAYDIMPPSSGYIGINSLSYTEKLPVSPGVSPCLPDINYFGVGLTVLTR